MIIDAKELNISELKGKGRTLCIDYGDKRVGIAITDITWMIASPLTALESNGIYQKLIRIIEDYKVKVIIVGLPKALNGGASGKQLDKVKRFVTKLDVLCKGAYIILWDERQSTNGAIRILDKADISRSQYKTKIDKIAASFILEGFLDYCRLNATMNN